MDIKKEAFKENKETPLPELEYTSTEPNKEAAELLDPDRLAAEQLKKKIESMELADDLKKDAEENARYLRPLPEKEKINALLKTAKEKGVVYAVRVAKDMDDPYLLDTFHDVLADEGYYKEFLK